MPFFSNLEVSVDEPRRMEVKEAQEDVAEHPSHLWFWEATPSSRGQVAEEITTLQEGSGDKDRCCVLDGL